MITVADSEVEHLYHYQPTGCALDDFSYVETILKEDKINFSDPRKFNDPWDCRPYYDLSFIDTSEGHYACVDYLIEADKKYGPAKSTAERESQANRLRSDKAFLKSAMSEYSKEIAAAISQLYRVFCLSPKNDCLLMWGHYADKHQNICLEFSTKNDVFSSALKVVYSMDCPQFKIIGSNLENELLAFLVKPKAWEYESEYRLISEEEDTAKEKETLKTKNGYLKIPQGSLTSIIAGCQMSEDRIKKIHQLIESTGSKVRLKQAKRHPDQYKLTVNDYSI